ERHPPEGPDHGQARRLGAVDDADHEGHGSGGVAALVGDDRTTLHRVPDDDLVLLRLRRRDRSRREDDQREQHHPPTCGKPPNCDEIRETPTILRGWIWMKTHWSAVGHVTSSQRPSGERTTCLKTPVPRKSTRPPLTTSLCPACRRIVTPLGPIRTRRRAEFESTA